MAKAKKSKEITREITGPLLFQRVGSGRATFMASCLEIVSNSVVQFHADVLPEDYAPGKYAVSGEVIYKIIITEK